MEHDFLGLPAENFRQQRNIWKSSPVFADGIFQTEICVPFLQSHLWYQFQALPAVFRGYMELICTNGKRDSRTKFASPELCEPFTNTTNRPVCQNKTWGNWSPAHISRAFHLCVIPTMWEPGTGYLIINSNIPQSWNFGRYIKWYGPSRFGPTRIFGNSFEGGLLWPIWSFR